MMYRQYPFFYGLLAVTLALIFPLSVIAQDPGSGHKIKNETVSAIAEAIFDAFVKRGTEVVKEIKDIIKEKCRELKEDIDYCVKIGGELGTKKGIIELLEQRLTQLEKNMKTTLMERKNIERAIADGRMRLEKGRSSFGYYFATQAWWNFLGIGREEAYRKEMMAKARIEKGEFAIENLKTIEFYLNVLKNRLTDFRDNYELGGEDKESKTYSVADLERIIGELKFEAGEVEKYLRRLRSLAEDNLQRRRLEKEIKETREFLQFLDALGKDKQNLDNISRAQFAELSGNDSIVIPPRPDSTPSFTPEQQENLRGLDLMIEDLKKQGQKLDEKLKSRSPGGSDSSSQPTRLKLQGSLLEQLVELIFGQSSNSNAQKDYEAQKRSKEREIKKLQEENEEKRKKLDTRQPPPAPRGFQLVTCRQLGNWIYCNDVSTGKPVVKFKLDPKSSPIFFAEFKKNPGANFIYDKEKNVIVFPDADHPPSEEPAPGNRWVFDAESGTWIQQRRFIYDADSGQLRPASNSDREEIPAGAYWSRHEGVLKPFRPGQTSKWEYDVFTGQWFELDTRTGDTGTQWSIREADGTVRPFESQSFPQKKNTERHEQGPTQWQPVQPNSP